MAKETLAVRPVLQLLGRRVDHVEIEVRGCRPNQMRFGLPGNLQPFAHFDPSRSGEERWPLEPEEYSAKYARVDAAIRGLIDRCRPDWLGLCEVTSQAAEGLRQRLFPRAHSASPPIVFFCEWIDPWLMGDRIPGPSKVQGTAFQVSCLTRIEALAWADSCGNEQPEYEWLAARFREAASVWCGEADRVAILAIREVLGPSITDEEVLASLTIVPPWLFGD